MTSHGGSRSHQVFVDVESKRIWSVRLKDKTFAESAVRDVLTDCRKRCGKEAKYLQTDGIFRIHSFKEMSEKLRFIHVRSPAYDHSQSAIIDRECRTMLETVSTMLAHSGAPPSLWGEASAHWTHTKNNTPTHEVVVDGKKTFLSPENVLQGVSRPYSLKHLVGFGTQVQC
jgi:hypothetical protein